MALVSSPEPAAAPTPQPHPAPQGQPAPWLRLAPILVGGALLIALPLFVPPYTQGLITKILIFGIFAMSLDLLYGYTGLPSLGHAACFGMGAYTVAVFLVRFGIKSFWLVAPASVLVSALAAALLGVIALRVAGMYFLLVTFALGQLLFTIAWKWRWLSSGGVEGLTGLGRPDLGIPGLTWSDTSFYYFVVIVLALCALLMYRVVNSPFGRVLQGIREREIRMQVLGYNTWLFKYLSFIITGAIAGVAGLLFAYHTRIVMPSYFDVSFSALAFLMVIIGGTGTMYGPVLGAAVIGLLEFYVGVLVPDRWPLVLGAAFVLSVMYLRAGVGPALMGLWRRAVQPWMR